MSVENVTVSRGYPLPYPDNDLSFDVGRIIAAINGLDVDVATIIANLAGKAPTSHEHSISEVAGLQAAIDGKIGTDDQLPLAQILGLQPALDAKAPVNNAAFTGTTTGVSPSAGANNTQFATTAWVRVQGYLTSIATANIGDNQVTSPKLADGAATTPKIGDNAVTAGKLADAAVSTTAKMADAIVTYAKLAASAIASGAEFRSDAASKLLAVQRVWEAAAPIAITDAASLTADMATFINATIAKTTNGTLNNPTNPKPGQCGFIVFTQNTAGATTQAFGANWRNVGVKTALQTGNGKKTRLDYSVVSATEIHYSLTWVP